MRRIASLFLFAALGLLTCTSRVSAQTTYTQTNRVCLSYQCVKAEFVPAAELSYYIPSIHGTGTQSFANAEAIWNGAEYLDFAGTYTYVQKGSASWCTGTNWACYELKGTFNSGSIAITERWMCFRSCGNSDNIYGSVTVQ